MPIEHVQLVAKFRMHDTAALQRARHFVLLIAALIMLVGRATWASASETPSVIGNTIAIEDATDLKTQPLALLAKFPEGGAAMAHFVAQAIIDRPGLVDAFLSIASDTSPQQAAAIGAGMVRGTRVLATKQSSLAQAIANKIMQSNNAWLKTSFFALGPRYSKDSVFVALEPLPPAPLVANSMGAELPIYRSRIGPTREGELVLTNHDIEANNRYGSSEDSHLLNRSGTIIAILASDARSNGATSTSPTN